MYHDTEHYRLRFEKAERSISGTPELILSCHARQLPIITRRLAILRERMQPDADQYLNQAHTECSLPEPDLFGHIQFGYDKCAYICKQDETASLHFPLQQSR